MTEKLQRKFIVTAMTAISVLLTVLLGGINLINMLYSVHESTLLLDALCEAVTGTAVSLSPEVGGSEAPPEGYSENSLREELLRNFHVFGRNPNRKERLFDPEISEHIKLSAVYFVAVPDAEQNHATIYSAHSPVTDEEAQKLTNLVLTRGKTAARTTDYRYKKVRLINGKDAIVFLDLTEYRRANLRTLMISVLADSVCWGLMLLLVIRLSKRAILPFAENIQRQKQFVTDAGHELKTPLAIILANTEALELHGGENKWSRNIYEQTVRLSGLMQNLLTLARIDENTTLTAAEEISLTEIVNRSAEMFSESAALRGLTLETNAAPDVRVRANADLLSRLLSILIDNAVKYAVPESVIHISVENGEKHKTVRLTNRCEKLPDCPPEKLFDRFYRADAARNQKDGGSGIGLSAAQAIVHLHKGTLTAEYGDNNKITFTVKL